MELVRHVLATLFWGGAIVCFFYACGCASFDGIAEGKMRDAKFDYSPDYQVGVGGNSRGLYVYACAGKVNGVEPCGRVYVHR